MKPYQVTHWKSTQLNRRLPSHGLLPSRRHFDTLWRKHNIHLDSGLPSGCPHPVSVSITSFINGDIIKTNLHVAMLLAFVIFVVVSVLTTIHSVIKFCDWTIMARVLLRRTNIPLHTNILIFVFIISNVDMHAACILHLFAHLTKSQQLLSLLNYSARMSFRSACISTLLNNFPTTTHLAQNVLSSSLTLLFGFHATVYSTTKWVFQCYRVNNDMFI